MRTFRWRSVNYKLDFGSAVTTYVGIAKHSRKQTHSEGQRGLWGAITSVGPRQSLLSRQGPPIDICENLIYLKCTAQAHIPTFLKPGLESVKGRYNQVTAMTHNQKGQLAYIVAYTNGCPEGYKVIGHREVYCILSDCGKSWYGIWCSSVREACSAAGVLSPRLPGT